MARKRKPRYVDDPGAVPKVRSQHEAPKYDLWVRTKFTAAPLPGLFIGEFGHDIAGRSNAKHVIH